MTKEFLSSRRVPFTFKVLDEPESIEDIKRRLGYLTAPVTVVGDEVVMGFDRAGLTAALERANLYAPEAARPEAAVQRASAGLGTSLAGAVAVTNFYGDSLTLLDGRGTGYLCETPERSTIPLAGHPADVVACPAAGTLAVVNHGGGSVTFLSLRDGSFLNGDYARSTRATGALPMWAAAHPSEPLVYVSDSDPGAVVAFNAATGDYRNGTLENSRLVFPSAPYQLAFHPKEDLLYVALRGREGVAVLEGRTMKPLRGDLERSFLPTGGGRGVVVSPDGKVLLRTRSRNTDGSLALFDALTGEPLFGSREASQRPTGPLPLDLAAHPTRPIVYVSCLGRRAIALHDAATGEYLFGTAERSTVEVGRGARGMVVDPRTDTLYVTCFDEDAVVLVDAATGAYRGGSRPAATLAAGRAPLGVRVLA